MIEKLNNIPEVRYISDKYRLVLTQNSYTNYLGYLDLEVKQINSLKEEIWVPKFELNSTLSTQDFLESIWTKLK